MNLDRYARAGRLMATASLTGDPKSSIEETPMGLIDLCDELSVAKHFVGCLYLACQQMAARDERAALCSVASAARDKLEAVEAALQQIVQGSDLGPGRADRRC